MKACVVSIVGTRPEAIKMAPVIRELDGRASVEQVVVATSQHREMLDQVLDMFAIEPHYDLDLMRREQGLGPLAARVLTATTRLFQEIKPDIVLVQGDTTTVLAAALSCFYAGIQVGHVEAGLRSHDLRKPYPEELNRRVVGTLAEMHFAPTPRACENLVSEGVAEDGIFLTGNTIVDALGMLETAGDFADARLNRVDFSGCRVLVVTAHRRESHGPALQSICEALARLVKEFADVEVVFPVHLNPRVRDVVYPTLAGIPGIHLVEPLRYDDMVKAMKRSFLLLTDSGGIQEEAPALCKPVLVLRDVTERPEVVEAGAGEVVGTSSEGIFAAASRLLLDAEAYAHMVGVPNPFGDGRAAERIADLVEARAGLPSLSTLTIA